MTSWRSSGCDMEKKLIVALAAMVEIVRRYKAFTVFTDEEVRAYENAVKLLAEAQAKCDDCVDY